MEGTRASIVITALGQGYILIDNSHDIGFFFYRFNDVIRNTRHLTPSLAELL